MSEPTDLRARLRLMLITDGRGDPARVERVVQQALDGGVRCVQLREPDWSARVLLQVAERLLRRCEAAGATLLVNDRIDVAAAGGAHGAQVGHRSVPPELARRVLGPAAVLGFSAHDAAELELAVAAGCDFALLAPVWPTASKPGAPHLGPVRAARLTAMARLPVLWLGGIDAAIVEQLSAVPVAGRPIGIAVRSAIMAAADPTAAAAALLAAWPPTHA
ncbi:MAG: thiamine phosphate synthase [Planctomycetes bacterium]|jgi:thiamine-phosphate pyrophosphorylase|nr:thiamine phosphate synthase [Planctomycetota bacterium]